MGRFFTLEEAEGLIPRLREWLQQAIEAKKEAVEVERELRSLSARINALGGVEIDPTSVAKRKLARHQAVERLQEAAGNIEKSGALVKDLDTGLIDFPALLENEEVYLCWKLGESRIEYWHRIQDGFAGRKRIADDFGQAGGSGKPN